MHKKRIKGIDYYYASIREKGRVKTIYLGRDKKLAKTKEAKIKGIETSTNIPQKFWIFILILLIFGGAFLLQSQIIGYFTAFVTPEITEVNLTVGLTFESGDFLPKDVIFKVNFNDQISSLTLEEFLDKAGYDYILSEGEFYSEGTLLNGSGIGIGEEFITGDKTFAVDIREFNITPPNKSGTYPFRMQINYNYTILKEILKNVTISIPIPEEPVEITEENVSVRFFKEKILKFLPEKKNFKINEKPKFRFISKNIFSEKNRTIEESPVKEDLKVFVYGPDHKILDIQTNITESTKGEFEIELSKARAYRSGLYNIMMRFEEFGETCEQETDFLWGVLAINTHKSIYLENEEAFIGIAVLDNEGHMVCDADVMLDITDLDGKSTLLSTSDGSIQISDECSVYGVTNLPDYYTYYTVNSPGIYTMGLMAQTSEGFRTLTDTFEVRDSVDFDVARDGPTRIYPPAKYQMLFTINPNRDYQGLIKEYVPSSFEITPQEDLTVTESGDAKILEWNTIMNPDQTHTLTYEFDAPDVSPYIFTLGPLEIGGWKEAREWMIASDAPVNLSSCQNITSSNTVYRLNTSISSNSGICLNITANNVTIDGAGHNITFAITGTGTAIFSNGTANLTIKNLQFNQTDTTRVNSYAIHFENSYGHNITNNTFDMYGEDNPDAYNYVIYFVNTTNSTIIGNDIIVESGCDYCDGIHLTSGSHNMTISNNTFNMKGGYLDSAILSDTSDDHTIYNNTITQKSGTIGAIRLYNSDNSLIDKATIDVSPSGWARSIDLEYYSENNTINNTVITTIDMNTIYIYNNADENKILNTNITATGASSGYRPISMTLNSHGTYMDNLNIECGYDCLYASSANNWEIHNSNLTMTGTANQLAYFYGDNWLINNTIMTVTGATNGEGLEIRQNCDNARIISSRIKTYGSGTMSKGIITICTDSISIKDTIINSTNDDDVYFSAGTATYNFTNVTFTDKTWATGATSTLNVHWYLDVHVNDTHGNNINNANVTAYNKNNNKIFNQTTESSGQITRQEVLEYTQDNDDLNYKTPHKINAIKDGYYEKNETLEIDGNKQITITLTNTTLPNVEIISPVNGRTYPSTSVLVNITNSSNVETVVYNWNGTNATYLDPHNIDFTLGSITLYAYANNTNGTSVDVITFTTSQGIANVTDCQDLDSPNIIYQLNQSITSDYGMCFEVKADNVTLEGNDYTLTYASVGLGTAIYMEDYDNLTVRNLKIEQTSSVRANSPGIHIQNSKDNNITNNTFDIDGEDNPDAYNYVIYFVNTTNSTIIGNDITAQTTCDYCHAVYLTSGSHNTTIEHNTIYTAGNWARGIYSHTSNNQTIYNNTIDVNDMSGNPVYLYQSNNCVINYTTIDSSGDARGIRVELSENNVIDNVDITTTSLNAIYFFTGSENNNITNTNITSTSYQTISMEGGGHGSYIDNVIARCSYRCLYTANANDNWEVHNSNFTMTSISNELGYLDGDNWLINNTIMTVTGATNGEGLEIRTNCNNAQIINSHIKTYGSGTASDALISYCSGPDSVIIKDTTINSTNDNDVYFSGGTATYNFTNVTFTDKAWGATATATLNVFWYLDVHVNDTSGDLENANVTAWDTNTNWNFENFTSSSGWIETQEVLEYSENDTGSTYYTNYTVNASLYGYETGSQEVNLTTNKVLYFTLSDFDLYPVPFLGTNPENSYVDDDGIITFDLKCSDDDGVDTLQLWGNWTGSWTANQTNSTPANDTFWNVTVSGIPQGNWKWGAWCNDTSGQGNWSINRTFSYTIPINITLNINPNPASPSQNVSIYGHVNKSDGTNITSNIINIYVNESLHYVNNNSGYLENTTDWWNTNWGYRRKINVESLVSTTLNNTITMINFSTEDLIAEGKLRNDCGDTRFIDFSGNELDYTLETSTCNSSNTIYWVWVNLTGSSNNTIFAYYGNTSSNLPTDYTNPDDDLVLYMHFDNSSAYGENDTNAYDFSKNGNNGTIGNGNEFINTTGGKFGGCAELPGASGDKIIVTSSSSLTVSNTTILLWVMFDVLGTNDNMIGRWQSGSAAWLFRTDTADSNELEFSRDGTANYQTIGQNVLTAGTWQLVGVTYDGDAYRFYVDGENVYTSGGGQAGPTQKNNLVIGGLNTDNYEINGKIDEVRIYKRTLSDDEILAIYNSTKDYYLTNHSLPRTDGYGNYNYTLENRTLGHYAIKVNTSYHGKTAEASETLIVQEEEACSVDFNMTFHLQAGIMFSEQDPGTANVSAISNGNYNVTDNSTGGCGTVNVSIRATGDLTNGSTTIGIGNVTVNSTSPDSYVIQLSTTYQLIRSNVPAGEYNRTTLYFWLTTPSGQTPKVYGTDIYIRENKE